MTSMFSTGSDRPSARALSSLRDALATRRATVRGRRELASVLAGHRGATMREEVLSILHGA